MIFKEKIDFLLFLNVSLKNDIKLKTIEKIFKKISIYIHMAQLTVYTYYVKKQILLNLM
jgi:hypothetical protein